MTEFVRVRSVVPGHPLTEFDIPTVTLNRHPDRYTVIDKKPVAKQRPASHIPGLVSEIQPRKAAPKTGEDKNAPSAGLIPEEEN